MMSDNSMTPSLTTTQSAAMPPIVLGTCSIYAVPVAVVTTRSIGATDRHDWKSTVTISPSATVTRRVMEQWCTVQLTFLGRDSYREHHAWQQRSLRRATNYPGEWLASLSVRSGSNDRAAAMLNVPNVTPRRLPKARLSDRIRSSRSIAAARRRKKAVRQRHGGGSTAYGTETYSQLYRISSNYVRA